MKFRVSQVFDMMYPHVYRSVGLIFKGEFQIGIKMKYVLNYSLGPFRRDGLIGIL